MIFLYYANEKNADTWKILTETYFNFTENLLFEDKIDALMIYVPNSSLTFI